MKPVDALEFLPGLLLIDMDDTLFDTEALNQELLERFFACRGKILDAAEKEFIIGASVADIFDRFAGKKGSSLMREFFGFKTEALASCAVEPAEGIEELLSLPIKKAVVSGSAMPEILAVMKAAGTDPGRFDAIYPIERYAAGKPDPAGYRMAMEDFRTEGARCLVLEDSPAGVASAKAAGARVALVRQFARLEDDGTADYEARTLLDAAHAIRSLL